MKLKDETIRHIQDRSSLIAVVGAGYVGLPSSALFATAGFHVIAVDIKPRVVESINRGLSSINEPGLNELLSQSVQRGRLRATMNSNDALDQASIIIVCVQTPIDAHRNPNLTFLVGVLEQIGKALKPGKIVVLCSTVPPRTMLETVKPKLESLSGLNAEKDFFLAYAPERIAPGRILEEFVQSPRLVGGVGPSSTIVTAELFRTVCNKVVETEATTAEVAKLAENTFRDINIAFANQLALICEHVGADVVDTISLANTHPRVNIHKPGPGVGGPCIPKDPYLLVYQSEHTNHDIIKIAREINDNMPIHVVKMVVQALENAGKPSRGSTIAILGTAYKSNTDSPSLSPSKPVIDELIRLGLRAVAYDPCCRESFGAKRADSLYEAVTGTDCMVIITDHTQFKDLDLKKIKSLMKDRPALIDARRIVNPGEAKKLGFIYRGLGFPSGRNP